MSDENNLDKIELIEQKLEGDKTENVETNTQEQESTVEETPPKEPKTEESEAEEPEGEKPLEELPLPGDDTTESKKTLPKWVEKKLSRKELELQQKEHEAAQLKAELERVRTNTDFTPNAQQWIDHEAPKKESFTDEGQYIAAVVAHTNKRQQQAAQLEAQRHALLQAENTFVGRLKAAQNEGEEKYEDFDEITKPLFSPGFPANRAMAEAIVDSEHKSDILYFLGKYKDKAKEIASLNPVQAVKKIAEIEARFNSRDKSNASKAPKPIESIKSNQVKGAAINSLQDLSMNADKMSQAEFEAAYKKLSSHEEVWGV